MLKREKILFGALVVIMLNWRFPRWVNFAIGMKTSPPTEAKALWQWRESQYFGSFGEINDVNKTDFINDFPWLNDIKLNLIYAYTADKAKSLDLILDKSVDIDRVRNKLENSKYVTRLYSPDQAKAAFGYYYEQKQMKGNWWLHIGKYE